MSVTNLTKEQAQAALKKYGSLRAAAKALGVSRKTVRLRLKGIVPKQPRTTNHDPRTTSPKAVGFTRDDFKRKYDKSFIVPHRIREALKQIGPNRYLPEGEFNRLAGISQTDMAAYREQFEDDYVVTVERTKRLWCGSKALANEFRGDQHG